MRKLIVALKELGSQEAGASVVEYGLLVGLIAVIAFAALMTLQTAIALQWASISSAI